MQIPATLAVTANDLGLKNPQRAHGLALLGLALIVGVFLAVRIPWLVGEIRSESLSLSERWALLTTGVPTAAFALIVTLGLLYRGAIATLAFFVQAGAPASLRDPARAVPTLLIGRTIDGTYVRPTTLVQLLLARLFPRFVYLTPPHHPLMRGFVLPVVLLLAALVFWLVTGWFPGWLLLAVLLALGAATAAMLLSAGNLPRVDVYEGRLRLTEAGNPADLFIQVQTRLATLREGTFPNRVLMQEPPKVGVLAQTNQFEADILMETQPLPITGKQRLPVNALVLDLAGVVLGVLGWALVLFRSATPLASAAADAPKVRPGKLEGEVVALRDANDGGDDVGFWPRNAAYLLGLISGLLTLELSRRFFRMAYCLYNTFRFRSDLLWVRFSGTYMASKIGVGDGRGGQFFSHKDRVQSDVTVTMYGTRLISECTPPQAGQALEHVSPVLWPSETALSSPRYIVEALRDVQLQQRLALLLDALRTFRDSSDVLAGVRLSAASVEQIVGANLQLTSEAEGARAAGAGRGVQGLPPPPPLPVALPPPPVPISSQPPPFTTARPVSAGQPPVRPVACPHCGQRYQVPADQAVSVRCQRCQQLFAVAGP
jgi:hypothetical protein